MKNLLLVFLAGGAGSALRYALGLFLHTRAAAPGFPWATLAANLLGCFLIGLFHALSSRLQLSAEIRLLLTVGFCGGLTTFSTLCNESLALLRHGHPLLFTANLLLSLLLGLAAVTLGHLLASPR